MPDSAQITQFGFHGQNGGGCLVAAGPGFLGRIKQGGLLRGGRREAERQIVFDAFDMLDFLFGRRGKK